MSVLQQNADGWWKCRNSRGEEGYLPMNYLGALSGGHNPSHSHSSNSDSSSELNPAPRKKTTPGINEHGAGQIDLLISFSEICKMDPVSSAQTVLVVCVAIYEQAQMVRCNKEQSLRLGERSRLVGDMIKGLIPTLPTSMQVTHLVKQERKLATPAAKKAEDEKDRQADFQALMAKQDEILQLNKEAKEETQQLALDEENRHLVLMQQMASMQFFLQERLRPQKKEKPPISEKLLTPFYELNIDGLLAKGSFGHIYHGRWFQQEVAIKMIEGKLTESERKEFIREVRIMKQLRSKHVMTLYAVCDEPNRACLVMEYTGKKPYADLPMARVTQKLMKAEHEIIPPTLPEAYQRLLRVCWSENRHSRPSMAQVIEQLRAFAPSPKDDKKEAGASIMFAPSTVGAQVGFWPKPRGSGSSNRFE